MAANKDLLLVDNDLSIINGDFVIGVSDEQHIQDNINSFPGWWKENYADGVGIFQFLNSTGQEQVIARSIKLNLQGDGYQVNNATVAFDASGNLIITPNATKN